MRKGKTIETKKTYPIFYDKAFIILCTSVVLGISLIFTNIELSKKTYQIIDINYSIDKTNEEIKMLKQSCEEALSPYKIREIARDKLKMINVQSIDEMIEIMP